MAILNIALCEGRLTCLAAPEQDIRLPLVNAIAALPEGMPIVIMVHGYSHHPLMPSADPTQHIFASEVPETSRRKSWPLAMGFEAGSAQTGLCVTYSWPGCIDAAASWRQRLNRFSTIYARSEDAATNLARLIGWLRDLAPDRPINLLAHSLGSRTALLALRGLPNDAVSRVVLMGAAVFRSEAAATLQSSAAAQSAQILNITARENDPFDLLFEAIAPRGQMWDVSLGKCWPDAAPNWIDMQLDHPQTARVLARHGIGLGTASGLISHCGFYERPGIMTFYRRLLADTNPLCWETLALDLAQVMPQPRYATLIRAFTRTLHRFGRRKVAPHTNAL